MNDNLEILPITVEQCVKSIIDSLSTTQLEELTSLSFEQFKNNNIIKKLNLLDKFALSNSNNTALIENCTKHINSDNDAFFMEIISPQEALDFILLSTWEKIVF